MTTLFYKAITQTPEILKNELSKRITNEEIKLEIKEQYASKVHPYENEFIGQDASNAIVWIDEYISQEMKLPAPTDVFRHIQSYNELQEIKNMEIEIFEEMNDYYDYYDDFEESVICE